METIARGQYPHLKKNQQDDVRIQRVEAATKVKSHKQMDDESIKMVNEEKTMLLSE